MKYYQQITLGNSGLLCQTTRFITPKTIKPAQLETKSIILEFNRSLTNPVRFEDGNHSPEEEESALN